MNFQSNYNSNITNKNNGNNEINSLKLPKSLLESVNIIYDDDFISQINKISLIIKENYNFIKQIINKLQTISININNKIFNKNLGLTESMKLIFNNNSKFWNNINEALNHNIFLIDAELNKFYEKMKSIFKKMKLIRSQKMKNIINIENTLNSHKTQMNNCKFIYNRNDNKIKKSNTKEFKSVNNIRNSLLINNKSPSQSNNNFFKLNTPSNFNRPNSFKQNLIINKKNNSINNIHNNRNNISKIDFHKNRSFIYSDNEYQNINNNSKELIKFEQLKSDLMDLCAQVIKNENNDNRVNINNLDDDFNCNKCEILYNELKSLKEINEKLRKEMKNKEICNKNIIMKLKKECNELLNDKLNNENNVKKINMNINNKNENKLMENLEKEMTKKNSEINQLKNRINILDVSLDSSLNKNKDLNNYINILKSDIEKLKANLNGINIKKTIKNKDLIISHDINFILYNQKIFSLKDYILVDDKIYQNLKWFLLKNKNSKNYNKYSDYIWIDIEHLNEKEINSEKDLFKFDYHSHNINDLKNKNHNLKIRKKNVNKNKFIDEINNSKHSYIISNIINNQYFIFKNKNINNNIEDLNKSYSFTKKLDNYNIYQKLMNFEKVNNNLIKLDNLAISKIDQENNDEENSLINEIKNINNKKDNAFIENHNFLDDNKILNDEAFMKTYNSAENELEAAKSQLVFIKKELRDLKNKFEVVKFSFINLFGKINFPKKHKVEIIQLLKLIGVDDDKIDFIFSPK